MQAYWLFGGVTVLLATFSIIGAVLSHTKISKRREFSMSDVEYYHKDVKKYYQPARGT